MKDYFNSDSFKELLSTYEKAIEAGESIYLDAEDFVDIADYYLSCDCPAEAMECIDNGIEIHKDDEDLLTVKTSALIYLHRLEEANEILQQLPDNDYGTIYYQRAQVAYALDHDVERAEEMFQDWIEYNQSISNASDEKVNAEERRDDYIHVISTFIELSEDRKYDPEVIKRWVEEYVVKFSPLGDYNQDLILCDIVREEGMADMIELVYSKVLETNPYINKGWSVLSTAQNTLGHIDKALESAEFALAIDPDDFDAAISKSYALYYSNRKSEAVPYILQYIKATGDDAQYLPLASSYMAAGQLPEAIDALDKVSAFYLKEKKENPLLYSQAMREICEIYYGCEDLQKALHCINEAIEAEPGSPDDLLLKGSILLSLKDNEASIDCFIQCIEVSNDKIWYTMGVAARFIFDDQPDIALEMLDTCTEYEDENNSLKYLPAYRAFAYFKKEDANGYLDNLKLACQECPDCLEMLMKDYYPDNVEPKDYYDYILNRIVTMYNKNKKE